MLLGLTTTRGVDEFTSELPTDSGMHLLDVCHYIASALKLGKGHTYSSIYPLYLSYIHEPQSVEQEQYVYNRAVKLSNIAYNKLSIKDQTEVMYACRDYGLDFGVKDLIPGMWAYCSYNEEPQTKSARIPHRSGTGQQTRV